MERQPLSRNYLKLPPFCQYINQRRYDSFHENHTNPPCPFLSALSCISLRIPLPNLKYIQYTIIFRHFTGVDYFHSFLWPPNPFTQKYSIMKSCHHEHSIIIEYIYVIWFHTDCRVPVTRYRLTVHHILRFPIHKLPQVIHRNVHQPLPGFPGCPGNVGCDDHVFSSQEGIVLPDGF